MRRRISFNFYVFDKSLPRCYVCTSVWMNHIDSNETHKEKTRCKLHKNTTSCFVRIVIAEPHKKKRKNSCTATYPHLTNNLSKTNKTCSAFLIKSERTHKRRSLMDSYAWTHQKITYISFVKSRVSDWSDG